MRHPVAVRPCIIIDKFYHELHTFWLWTFIHFWWKGLFSTSFLIKTNILRVSRFKITASTSKRVSVGHPLVVRRSSVNRWWCVGYPLALCWSIDGLRSNITFITTISCPNDAFVWFESWFIITSQFNQVRSFWFYIFTGVTCQFYQQNFLIQWPTTLTSHRR